MTIALAAPGVGRLHREATGPDAIIAHVGSPRRRRFASFLPRGSLEVTAAGLLLAGTVAGSFEVPINAVTMALSVAVCVLVALSGRRPVPVGLAIGALCTLLILALPDQETLALYGCLAPVVTSGANGLLLARRWFAGWAAALLFGQIATRIPGDISAPVLAAALGGHAVFVLAVVTMAWAAGGAFHLLLRQQQQEADGTLRSLRREIARDLHDGVAGTLSLIAIRAEQGRRQGGASVEDLEFIADKSREAIDDLRNVLAVLRRDQPQGSRFTMDWQARPLAEAIACEVAGLEEAGFPVSVTVEGALGAVPRSVSDAMSRVLHEAASNVRRHAGEGECVLLVSVDSDQIELALINPVRHGGHPTHEPLGVLGMRERIEALGGTFEAAAIGGHWILRASVLIVTSQNRTWR